jgi:hypothetical protein
MSKAGLGAVEAEVKSAKAAGSRNAFFRKPVETAKMRTALRRLIAWAAPLS